MSFLSQPADWESLLKKARELETELEKKMDYYQILISAQDYAQVQAEVDDDPLLPLLQQLREVNSQMQAWVSPERQAMVSRTCSMHRKILHDLNQEFHVLLSKLGREDFREFDRTELDLEAELGSLELALMKDHVAISRSTAQMHSVISHAQATLGALVLQLSKLGNVILPTASNTLVRKAVMKLVISSVKGHGNIIGLVNHILSAIKRKKSLHTIMLALVALICAFLVVIYWLSK